MAEQCEYKKDKSLSTREWIMVCALIVLGQWLLYYWSSESMNSEEILAYVSFAGTIVSMILAVLAIIYSFVQTQAQQSTSDSISREIFRLTDVTTEINKTSQGITDAVSQLPVVITQLEGLPEVLSDEIKSVMSEIDNSTKRLHSKTDTIIDKLDGIDKTQELQHQDEKAWPYFSFVRDLPSFALASYLIYTKGKYRELCEHALENLRSEQSDEIIYLLYRANAINESYFMLDIFNQGGDTCDFIFNNNPDNQAFIDAVKYNYSQYASMADEIVFSKYTSEEISLYIKKLFDESGFNEKNVKVEFDI